LAPLVMAPMAPLKSTKYISLCRLFSVM